jgi:hypothetical protein
MGADVSRDEEQAQSVRADVAIVTAIYGGHDVLKPVMPQDGIDVDWVLVTDTMPEDAKGWRVVVEPRPDTPPVRAAKRPKLLPQEYTDAPASIWVDAAYRIVSPRFVTEAIAHADPVAQFKHPWRDCLYAEAAALGPLGLDPDGDAVWQAHRYREAGHPEGWGLWASGVIARKHTAAVKRMGVMWAKEIDAGSSRDQVSQPFVLRKTRLRPSLLPGTHLANGWLKHEGHG